jgi:hypothetical protein
MAFLVLCGIEIQFRYVPFLVIGPICAKPVMQDVSGSVHSKLTLSEYQPPFMFLRRGLFNRLLVVPWKVPLTFISGTGQTAKCPAIDSPGDHRGDR